MLKISSCIRSILFIVAGILFLAGNASQASTTATANPGQTVTFTVSANGTAPFSYQWYKNGSTISGATSSSYVLSNVQTSAAGTYTAQVTNQYGSTTSDNGTLVVNSGTSAPVFTTQPSGGTISLGGSITLTAAASGSPTPTYQWRLAGINIPGATSSSLSIVGALLTNAGVYTVVATNSAGSVTSNSATLTVSSGTGGSAPVFTTQPSSQTVAAGNSVKFTAVASNSPTYQWKLNGSAISGATGNSYVISMPMPANAGTYTVVATNSYGSTTSSSATLTVTGAPVFSTQPVGSTVSVGSSVTLTAAASGSPSYQWTFNGNSISGATSSSYTISNVNSSNAGSYRVVATNGVGSTTSWSATLVVSGAAPVITSQPSSRSVATGSSASFSVVATGSPTPTYQWRKNGSNISGATSATYTISSVSSSNAATYSVVVSNSVGSVTSSGAVLTVTGSTPATVSQCDFNGDGKSDILWQNSTTLECRVWLMSGGTMVSNVSIGTPSAGWQVAGAGDFNGDGHTDIVWQNVSTGDRIIWFMSGTTVTSTADLGVVSTNWQIVGTGDFNGDGKCDILWQNNASGERYVWYMSGGTQLGGQTIETITTDWQICGTGDFNGDGKPDILWQNSATGECYIWLMSGIVPQVGVSIGTAPAGWEMCGGGDYNGDGQADILWQNMLNGQRKIWTMSGTNYYNTVQLGTVTTDWIIRN